MNLPNQHLTLLQMAKKDLKAAKILGVSDEPDIEIVGFHLQQATEKACIDVQRLISTVEQCTSGETA